nr:NAD-dependent epimerase/dehydratase family protein [Bradyrhizobium sp. BR 10289]
MVTGASGFVGSELTPALVRAGFDVRAASRRRTPVAEVPGIEWMKLPDLEYEVDWSPLLDGIEAVVHLAAIAHRTHADIGQYTRVNCLAATNLVKACAQRGIRRFVFVSSIGAQVGSAADYVVTEKHEPRPASAYDRAKLAAEEQVRATNVPFTILRPVIVYGPKARANIAAMMRIAMLPLPLPFAALKNRRSLLSIDNLVEAIIFCLKNPATANRTFIVSDGDAITLRDIIATLRGAAGRAPNMIWVPSGILKFVMLSLGRGRLWDRIGRDLVASSEELQQIGWRPLVDTRAGLEAMMREFLSQTK